MAQVELLKRKKKKKKNKENTFSFLSRPHASLVELFGYSAQ